MKIIEFLKALHGDEARKEFAAQKVAYEEGRDYPITWLSLLAALGYPQTEEVIAERLYEEENKLGIQFWEAIIELRNLKDEARLAKGENLDSASSYSLPAQNDPARMILMQTGLTAAEAEKFFGLPVGTVRRDIHRGKFYETEHMKLGRDWIVARAALHRVYGNKRGTD